LLKPAHKPLLSWPGAKYRQLAALLSHVPIQLSGLCEPFLGTGALTTAVIPRLDGPLFVSEALEGLAVWWAYMLAEPDAGTTAAFPVELPERLIRMYTFVGETVLDPFAGTGSTAVAAARSDRSSLNVERSPGAVSIMWDRFSNKGMDNVWFTWGSLGEEFND